MNWRLCAPSGVSSRCWLSAAVPIAYPTPPWECTIPMKSATKKSPAYIFPSPFRLDCAAPTPRTPSTRRRLLPTAKTLCVAAWKAISTPHTRRRSAAIRYGNKRARPLPASGRTPTLLRVPIVWARAVCPKRSPHDAWHWSRHCPKASPDWMPTKRAIACCSTPINSGRQAQTRTRRTDVRPGMDRVCCRHAHHLLVHSAGLAGVAHQAHQRHLAAHVHLLHLRCSALARLRHPARLLADHFGEWHHAATGRNRTDTQATFRLNLRFAGLQFPSM